MPHPPIFYSFRRCPYAMRARLGLMAAGQKVQLREIVLRHKPQHMLEVSPKGTVPVLVLHDGTVIEESLDIMLWALKMADPQQWLSPQNGTFEEMLTLIESLDQHFKPNLDRYKYPNRYPDHDSLIARDAALNHLAQFEARLAQHRFLFGETPTLADVATFPFIRQFAHVNKDWFFNQAPPKLKAWLETHLESEIFQSIMSKYTPWQDGDTIKLFPENTTPES